MWCLFIHAVPTQIQLDSWLTLSQLFPNVFSPVTFDDNKSTSFQLLHYTRASWLFLDSIADILKERELFSQ